jgi:hypothetical protein
LVPRSDTNARLESFAILRRRRYETVPTFAAAEKEELAVADVGIPKGLDAESQLDAIISQFERLAPGLSHSTSRSVTSRLGALQRILVGRLIETYDPSDRDGFAPVVKALTEHVPDHNALSSLLGVSLSTLYRWKAGESVPHLLARRAVKEHLIGLIGLPQEAPPMSPARNSRSH